MTKKTQAHLDAENQLPIELREPFNLLVDEYRAAAKVRPATRMSVSTNGIGRMKRAMTGSPLEFASTPHQPCIFRVLSCTSNTISDFSQTDSRACSQLNTKPVVPV